MQTDVDGITGNVKFDPEGMRSEFKVHFYDLIYYGFAPLGTWDPAMGLSINEYPHPTATGIDNFSFLNKTFIVLIAIVSGTFESNGLN